MQQRFHLSAEEQKVVNRWRLVVIGFYSSIALVTILFVALQPTNNKDRGTREARMQPPALAQPAKPLR